MADAVRLRFEPPTAPVSAAADDDDEADSAAASPVLFAGLAVLLLGVVAVCLAFHAYRKFRKEAAADAPGRKGTILRDDDVELAVREGEAPAAPAPAEEVAAPRVARVPRERRRADDRAGAPRVAAALDLAPPALDVADDARAASDDEPPASFESAEDDKGFVVMTKRRKPYSSGMVQGWGKFCFTGGIMEVRAKLPGAGAVGGLWPAMWLLGSLARATYVGSTDWIWPWSYDKCDRSLQPKQEINACEPVPKPNIQPDFNTKPDGMLLTWYLDDELIFELPPEALELTGAKMPDEPMHVLLNTAVSSTSRTRPAPAACPGLCAMLPAFYEIDYVRVYQNPDDDTHKVGCSTDTKPTAKFIAGHKERYFDAYNGETKPLHDQIVGGGKCKRDADCGPESACEAKACACAGDWLGPHCRAYRGFDDVVWEHEQTLGFHAPFVPASLGRAAVVLSTSLAATLAYHVLKRREGRQGRALNHDRAV
ncbi:hypothetical protein JL721_1276 [Aureococcus anophagefferens]|nr:hypothetical protein JL721_1276 [Aureococcus anophagefferens]